MKTTFRMKSLSKKMVGALILCAVVFVSVFVLGIGGSSQTKSETRAYNYADSNSVVTSLTNQGSMIEDSYSLLTNYPVVPENQTNSELCWIYSSMKALETSIMVQANEYYNFSDIATAYMAYKMNVKASLNATGRFEDFVQVALTYGLVYESEFGNEHYFDIDDNNIDYYDYVLSYADTCISDNCKPVALYSNTEYKNSNQERRLNIIKRYLKTYGGLFCGIEAGVIYSSGVNVYENDPYKETDGGMYLSGNHAVCLIGWNDDYGFLALNSWGVEEPKSYQTFYIPYSYVYIQETLNGFIYDNSEDDVSLTYSSANNFSTNIMDSSVLISNMFCYGEETTLTYILSDSVKFENVYVNIYKGTELVSSNFRFTYNDNTRQVTITLKDDASGFVGGTYVLKFYEDKSFVASKSLYIFTGTEVSYFKLQKNDTGSSVDSTLLMNSFVNQDNSETFYISSIDSYTLYFYLTPFNNWKNLGTSLNYSVSNLYKYEYDGENYTKIDTGTGFTYENGILKDFSNCYVIHIPVLNEFKDSKLEFTITVNSTAYFGVSREYVVTLFASKTASTKTADAKIVHYELNGGLNSPYNVKRLPLASRDSNISEFELYEPTKLGYDFIGWYTDSGFNNEIYTLNGSTSADITLYAKWSEDNTSYFLSTLALSNVYEYDGTPKSLSSDIVYGDKVKLKYNFTVLNELSYYNFSAVYYLSVNGVQKSKAELGQLTTELEFDFDLNTLKVGTYVININTVVVVSHSLSISQTKSVRFVVTQKLISFEFDELEFVYDGLAHRPKISVEENGFYAEDLGENSVSDMFTVSDVTAVNIGSYTFEILGIDNTNYAIEGTSSCTIIVNPREITIMWNELSKTYNGDSQIPDFEVVNKVDGDSLNVKIDTSDFKNVGKYTVGSSIIKLDNSNYILAQEGSEIFEILPAKLTIKFDNVNERIQISPAYRKKPTYVIEGLLYDPEANLDITIKTDGLTVEKSGVYPITATYDNINYDIEFVGASYILSGDYSVYYKLPNREVYIENVKEGENPKGINNDIYKVSKLAKVEYSEELVNNYEDMYIDVTVTDYTWIVVVGVIIVAFAVIYLALTHKARRNKVS